MKKVLRIAAIVFCSFGVLSGLILLSDASVRGIGIGIVLFWSAILWLILRKKIAKKVDLSHLNEISDPDTWVTTLKDSVRRVKDQPKSEREAPVLSAKDSEKAISDALINKKDVSFQVSGDDIDELARKFPSQKLYLQAPIILKIEAATRFKSYQATIQKIGKGWSVENFVDPSNGITYHILKVKAGEIYYKTELAQTLIPLSRVVQVQYQGKSYPMSEFKTAVFSYKEGAISRLEDHFDVERNKVWEPEQDKVSDAIIDFALDFVAIDFETANNSRSSACSIGLVLVQNGEIVERIHRLINPGNIEWGQINMAKHGIKPNTVRDSPSFTEVWEELSPYFNKYPLIAHNAASFDISVLRSCLMDNGIPIPAMRFGCTMEGAKALGWPPKLKELSALRGIKLDHHNALSDAEACAQIAIDIYRETSSFKSVRIRAFY